jgi:hypothetical protein
MDQSNFKTNFAPVKRFQNEKNRFDLLAQEREHGSCRS